MSHLPRDPLENYFHSVDATSLLDAQEEHQLALRIRNGDLEARDHLIRANLRLVVYFARKFIGRGLSMDDLIQEGNIGLMRAVEGFDPDMNTRFTTYARYWITQVIRIAVESSSASVHVPSYALDLVAKWKQVTAQLTDRLRHPPTEVEVGREMHLRPKQMRIVQKALRIFSARPTDQDSWKDDIVDRTAPPDQVLENLEETGHAVQLLERLDPREAAILRYRFGLDGKDPMPLDNVGTRFGLTRERVRQIEKIALEKLKAGMLEGAA